MLFLAVLEAAAFIALIPLMQLLTSSNLSADTSAVNAASDFFGNPSSSDLARSTLAVIVVGVYIVKSFAAVGVIRWCTTFALARNR